MSNSLGLMPWITLIFAGLNGLIALGLALMVVARRFKHRVLFGDGGADGLSRAIRAHGNNAEYVPLALVLMALIELCGRGSVPLIMAGVALTLGRLAHGIGLNRSAGKSTLRAVGALLTFVVIAGLAAWAVALGVGRVIG